MSSPDRRPPTPEREMSAFEKGSLTENYICAFREALMATPGYQKSAAERILHPHGKIEGPIGFTVGRTKYVADYLGEDLPGETPRDPRIHHEKLVIARKAYKEGDVRIELSFKLADEEYVESTATYIPNFREGVRNQNSIQDPTEAFRKISIAIGRLRNPIHD